MTRTTALLACLLLAAVGAFVTIRMREPVVHTYNVDDLRRQRTRAQATCGVRLETPRQPLEVWPEELPVPDYLDALDACLARGGAAPTPKLHSLWLENQRTAYAGALKKQRVEVIVVPFQVQGYGLERAERALMSVDLAYHIDPAVRVADPFLTARALGESARRYETDDIAELARAVGARTAVVGYVGHDRQHRMNVTIQVLKIGEGGSLETLQRDWRGVAFTDSDPPFMTFHRMLPSLLESVSLPVAQPRERTPVVFPSEAGFSVADLATEKSPIGPSLGLSLLGAMTASSDERSREQLSERALVASWHFDAPSAETTFLQAYALLNLEHRPAALALIDGSTTPESVALRALLNGDLPGAAAALPAVENPLERLMLAVHVDDLRYTYGKDDVERATDATSVFGEDAADWRLLAEGRANDANIWRADEPPALKFLLDGIHPVTGLDLQSVVGGGAVVGAAVDDVAVDVATMRHIARFVASAEVPVCCSETSARAASWDIVSLLEGRTESRMSKYLHLMTVVRSAPESATDAISRYRAVFDGHPLFSASRAEHAAAMGDKAEGDTLQRWQKEARDQGLAAATWSAGQSEIAMTGLSAVGFTSSEVALYVDAYGFDYPRRSYWAYSPLATMRSGLTNNPELEVVQSLREDAYPYARSGIYPFRYMNPQSEEEKARLLASLEGRFIGHPDRTSLMATLRPPPPSTGDPVADAKAAVDADPGNWNVRFAAGRKLIQEHGKWEEAAALMLADPYFHREAPSNMVVVSNNAFIAGSIFYWGGHEDLAVPFYQIAAGLQTGAHSQITSEIRLNVLEGHYRIATADTYARAQRYPDAYPFRDLLSFMHALGYGEQAWEGFSQVSASFDNPQIWVSALVGHRMQGMTEPEIRAWLKQPGIRDARFRNNLFAPRYAVMVNATDRMPPEDLGALVAELEGEPVARVITYGVIERPSPDGTSPPERLSTSAYTYNVPVVRAPEGTRIKSEFAFFGGAYAAIRHGRYHDAVEEFTAMATYYPIEHQNRNFTFALPYFAWAAAKTDDAAGFEKFINERTGSTFDSNLARAFFYGVRKDTLRARELLDSAFRTMPYTDYRPVLVEYQWAEACEWLYQETGDKVFVDMLLAWVASQQKVQPTHAWPYAMEYTYARDPGRKRRALAMTLYLDPKSPRIQEASTKERNDATAWGATNNLFLRERNLAETSGPTARVRAPNAYPG